MIRAAGPEDRAEVEARLTARMDEAMFPLTSLRTHGLSRDGFAARHDYASRFWLVGATGVVAMNHAEMLMAVLAEADALTPFRALLAGARVRDAVGPAQSIRPLIAVLGLDRKPTHKDHDEPGFGLDLANLALPHLPGSHLVPAADVDRALLVGWRAAYKRELMTAAGHDIRNQAEADIDRYIAQDSHRVLTMDGKPVALTGFNARLPEIVQVGGVYTPPDLRGRGYARRAVALHLVEARERGVRRSVLFAASAPAARAYRAIGFQPTQPFTLFVLAVPTRITP
jgi:GNAT superfamily N-acetyltransferase